MFRKQENQPAFAFFPDGAFEKNPSILRPPHIQVGMSLVENLGGNLLEDHQTSAEQKDKSSDNPISKKLNLDVKKNINTATIVPRTRKQSKPNNVAVFISTSIPPDHGEAERFDHAPNSHLFITHTFTTEHASFFQVHPRLLPAAVFTIS